MALKIAAEPGKLSHKLATVNYVDDETLKDLCVMWPTRFVG